MKNILLVSLVFAIIFILTTPSVLAQPFEPSSFTFFRDLVVVNNNESQTLGQGFTVNITIDHASLVSSGKALANGDDFRIVWGSFNATTHIELDRVNVTPFNTAITTIAFSVQADVAGGGTDTNYSLYYGNATSGTPPQDGSVVYDGAFAFYTFENNEVKDLVGNHDGTLNGTTSFIPNGELGGALVLDGSTGFSDINNPGIDFDFNVADNITIEMWINRSESHNGVLISRFDVSGSKGWSFAGTPTDNLEIILRASGANSLKVTSSGPSIKNNEWEHIIIHYNGTGVGSGIRMFINGNESVTVINEDNLAGNDFNTTKPVLIGVFDGLNFYNGSIDQLRISRNQPLKSHFITTQPRTTFSVENTTTPAVDIPPTFSQNQTNGTQAGTVVLHSLLWADDDGLDSFIFSFDNGSGTFMNDSSVSFGASPTSEWSNVSKSVPATIGLTIRWRVFANDTGGKNNASTIFTYTSTGAGSPVVSIDSPTNTTFTSVPIDLNVSADQTSSAWWLSLDSGPNITFTPNTTISPANGFHEITVFTNNTLGEEGQASIFFTVNVPAPVPEPTISGSPATIVLVIALMLGLVLILTLSRTDFTSIDSIIRVVIMVFIIIAFAGIIISFTV